MYNYLPLKKKSYKGIMLALYLIVTIAIYVLPALQYRVPYIFAASLMLVSLFLIIKDLNWLKYGVLVCLSALIYVFLNLFIQDFSLVDIINDAIRHIRYFIPVLWTMYVVRYCNKKEKKFMIAIAILIIGFIISKTIIAMEENRLIARLLAEDKTTSSKEINAYRLQNVGGFTFSYIVGFTLMGALWLFFDVRKYWQKVGCILLVCICGYYIIQTMYTTLLLFTIIGTIIIVFTRIKSGNKLILGLLLLILTFSLVPIMEYLSDAFSGILLGVKFADIAKTLSGEGVDVLGARPRLIREAFNNFCATPLFGGRYSTAAHSLYLEYLQSYGLIGATIWMSLYFYTWTILSKTLKAKNIDVKFFNIIMSYLLVLNFFNDMKTAFDISITVFFIVPLFSMLFCEKLSINCN